MEISPVTITRDREWQRGTGAFFRGLSAENVGVLSTYPSYVGQLGSCSENCFGSKTELMRKLRALGTFPRVLELSPRAAFREHNQTRVIR